MWIYLQRIKIKIHQDLLLENVKGNLKSIFLEHFIIHRETMTRIMDANATTTMENTYNNDFERHIMSV